MRDAQCRAGSRAPPNGRGAVVGASSPAVIKSPWQIAADHLVPEPDGRRPEQHPPDGDWETWVMHPGRGWGKGYTAAHWLRDRVRIGASRSIALVGSTQAHVRQLMIENAVSGILAVCPDARYIPSRAEVEWSNGAIAYMCSAENADEPPLRGGNFDTAWADECIAAGEPVLTLRGWVPIETVVVGDMVMTRAGWRAVAGTRCVGRRATWRVTAMSGATVRATDEHRFLAADGWRYLRDVSPRDALHTSSVPSSVSRGTTTSVSVASVRPAGSSLVYDLSVDGEHEFFAGHAGGFLVHNCDSWGHQTTNEKAQLAWDNLLLSVRLGDARKLVTSTPKPGRIISALLKEAQQGDHVRITTGSTYDNAANLSPQFIAAVERKYKGTRLERQEIYGEVLGLVHGGLWQPGVFQAMDVSREHLGRIVVGVDPSGGGDDIGIVAAGQVLGTDWYIVLDDWTICGPPGVWAERVVALYEKWSADCIVAERNFGGDMVESTIRNADADVPVRMVTASRGKHIRAEPISMLYEQGRVLHRRDGELALLEDQMLHMTTRGYEGSGSPDRLDSAVWSLTDLVDRDDDEQGLLNDGSTSAEEYEDLLDANAELERKIGIAK